MSVNWKTVKAKVLRRKMVDVELPEYDEAAAEARIDRESDLQRRSRLQGMGDDSILADMDRHQVRNAYRELFGNP